jgi:hypothetical protein
MDLQTNGISALRSYVLDYAAGTIWTVAILLVSGLPLDFFGSSPFKELLASSGTGATLLIALAAVIVPYCANIIMQPISLGIMNRVVALERFVSRLSARLRAKTAQDEVKSNPLSRLVRGVIRKHIPASDVSASRSVRLMLLRLQNQAMASWLDNEKDQIWFRATAAPPASLLAGAIVWRVVHPSAGASLVAVAVGLVVFVVAAVAINGELKTLDKRIDISIVFGNSADVAHLKTTRRERLGKTDTRENGVGVLHGQTADEPAL